MSKNDRGIQIQNGSGASSTEEERGCLEMGADDKMKHFFSGFDVINPFAGRGKKKHHASHFLRPRPFISDTNAGFIIKILLLLAAVLVIVLYWYTFSVHDVTCDAKEQVKFVGVLRGFQHNRTYYKLTDVLIGPDVIPVEILDKDYLRPMIGHNISLVCCRRNPGQAYRSSYPFEYFDVKTAFITLEE